MENSRIPGEHFFTTSDNTALFYRHWPALQPGAKKVIVLFHRGHEHSGRLQHLVDELAMPDTAFYAWDARGHGKTSGPRGYSPSLARSVQDVDEFVRFAASDSQVGLEEVVVIAQSVGAVLVATWVHDYAPAIRGLVLASPAFKVKLYVPLARPALALWHRLRGLFFINSYVKGRYLTHDRQRVASFNNDPLITRAIAVNILLDLYKTSERIIRDAAAITLPTQLLISGDDYVVHRQPQIDFYQRLRSPLKDCICCQAFITTRWVKRTGRRHLKKCKALLVVYMLTSHKNLIISMKTALDHQRIAGGSFQVDPCHYRRLIWRIALCERR